MTSQISLSEQPSTSIRITLERCATGRRMKVRKEVAAIWRLSTASSWSTIMSTSAGPPQRLLAVAPAQEIQRGVVRDPEQPAFGIADCAGASLRLHRLDQRVLQHVLAVDDRA